MIEDDSLSSSFQDLSTPLVADACLRLGIAVRVAPPGLRAAPAGARVAGRALPVRHFGSMDVFLEALGGARVGLQIRISVAELDDFCSDDHSLVAAGERARALRKRPRLS